MEKQLYNQFKKDHPETIGETDKAFDNSNYLEWLEKKLLSTPIKEEVIEAGGEMHWVEMPFGEWFNSDPQDGVYFYIDENGDRDIFKFENKYFLDMDGQRSQKKIGMKFVLTKAQPSSLSPKDKKDALGETLTLGNMKNVPAKIYLQVGADGECEDYEDLEQVSWCENKIHDDDIEYVLAKLAVTEKSPALDEELLKVAKDNVARIEGFENWIDLKNYEGDENIPNTYFHESFKNCFLMFRKKV